MVTVIGSSTLPKAGHKILNFPLLACLEPGHKGILQTNLGQ